jgi:DNA primase
MSKFIDFEAVKEAVSFATAIDLLGLQLKKAGNQWRGACPACKGGDRSLVITEGRGAYCFSEGKGGDVLWFASHIRGCDAKTAAQFLMDTVPQEKPASGEQKGGFEPLAYLEAEHEALQALGFNLELCKELGIGWAPKGILRGTIAIPIRDATGKLHGYLGATDLTIPASFMANVVEFKKKA